MAEQAQLRIRRGSEEFTAPSWEWLQHWAAEGRIVPSDYVYHPLLERWVYARDLEELKAAFGPTFSPGLAALLSFLIPGAGQMYRGKVGAGFGWLFGTIVAYAALIIPGLIVHVICVFDAASTKR